MGEPSAESVTLANLRKIRGWGQKKLASMAGLDLDTISVYERRRCSPEQLQRLGRLMEFSPEYVRRSLALVQEGREDLARPGTLSREEAASQEIDAVVAEEGRRYQELLRSSLRRLDRTAGALLERRAAPRLWRRLRRHPEERWRAVVGAEEDFWSWGLVELICEESERAASANLHQAERLAELALTIAERLPGKDLRAQAESYSWGFLGNARRVRGYLLLSDEAFARSAALWPEDEDVNACPLDMSRLLDLKASLRREQRRLPEALDLLGRAFKQARTDCAKARILLKKAKTLEETDNYAEAVKALRQASPFVERSGDLRLLLNLGFNLLENEVQEGRSVDVSRCLAQVRDLAVQLRNELDLIRLRWLEGRLAASFGQRAEAERAFRAVRDELAGRQMYYDMALVLLESAVLLLEEGRTQEVRELATCMEVIFRAEGVHREAIAALCLFHQAALQDWATVELARSVLAFLRRSRNNPELCFEPQGSPSPGRQTGEGDA